MFHENLKEFWKNSHFEKMRAGFLLFCKNLLRQTTPWKDAMKTKCFANLCLALDPIETKTYQAPQNDGLDFSFVRDFYVIGDKMTWMIKKEVINFQKISFQNWKSRDSETFVFYVVVFHPIKKMTCLALQHDRQNLCFVKDIYVVGKKMTRNGHKMTKLKSIIFWIETEYRAIKTDSFLCLILFSSKSI